MLVRTFLRRCRKRAHYQDSCMLRRLAPFTLAFAFIACSGGAAGPDAAGSQLTLAEYVSQFPQAYCAQQTRCGVYAEATACTQAIALSQGFEAWTATVASGNARFDATAASSCLQALAAASCDRTAADNRPLPVVCRTVLQGVKTAGQTCTSDSQCLSTICTIDNFAGTCPTGRCAAVPPSIGESCVTAQCASDAVCNGNTMRCEPLRSAGATCEFDRDCGAGLTCGSAPNRVCTNAPARGASCAQASCRQLGDACNAEQTCAPLGARGASCNNDMQCQKPLACDAGSNSCKPLPVVGEVCQQQCESGAYCESDLKVCIPRKGDLELCTSDDECLESARCDVAVNDATLRCRAKAVCN